jgi:hypothetical protein
MRQAPVIRDMHEQHRCTAWTFLSLLTRGRRANRAENAQVSANGDTTTAARKRRFALRLSELKGVCALIATVCLLSEGAFAQTTRTNPSAASTTPTVPSSSSTSPNAPCNSFNPTSPCYSGRSPRNPCYSAVTPNQPCSTTTTPNPQPSPTPSPTAAKTPPPAALRAQTQDQAKAQIEAKGYSKVSGLRRDIEGVWRGKAEKDGLVRNVTLDREGNVNAD